jgi:hypothetical protein
VVAAAASVLVPGRFQTVGERPLTIVDGAHNPGGMRALAESLAELPRPRVAVVSVLDDKDAGAMLAALLPLCDALVCTSNANPRALSPATLGSLAAQLGGPEAVVEADPHAALAGARARRPGGAVLATGSIYLVADLLRAGTSRRRSRCERRRTLRPVRDDPASRRSWPSRSRVLRSATRSAGLFLYPSSHPSLPLRRISESPASTWPSTC